MGMSPSALMPSMEVCCLCNSSAPFDLFGDSCSSVFTTSPMAGSASDLTMTGPLSSASNHAANPFTMYSPRRPAWSVALCHSWSQPSLSRARPWWLPAGQQRPSSRRPLRRPSPTTCLLPLASVSRRPRGCRSQCWCTAVRPARRPSSRDADAQAPILQRNACRNCGTGCATRHAFPIPSCSGSAVLLTALPWPPLLAWTPRHSCPRPPPRRRSSRRPARLPSYPRRSRAFSTTLSASSAAGGLHDAILPWSYGSPSSRGVRMTPFPAEIHPCLAKPRPSPLSLAKTTRELLSSR